MNGNGGTSTQGSPDEAKNIITVGSTKMRTSGGSLDNINDLSFNTAHGPALDGRTIPHLVAPGCRVMSTFPNSLHGLLCGTSMAAPHVAGSLGLFLQKYQTTFGTLPSPALGKAALTVVADSLAGNRDANGGTLGQPFDSKQGWGRLDLGNVLSPTVPTLYIDQTTLLTMTGQTETINVEVVDASQPVRIMLVWTDAPGHGLGGSQPAWNNDLDLQVTLNADSYLGNQFGANGYSVTGGSADYRNNTEAVFLAPMLPTGAPPNTAFRAVPLTISVVAANLTSDGVPNNGTAIDQDFALACYNCQLIPSNPVESLLEKTFNPASVRPGALISVVITQTLSHAGVHPYTLSITDTAPIGTIITQTVRLNGVITSATVANGMVKMTHSDTLTDRVVNVFSYQVVTDDDLGRIQTDVFVPYETAVQIDGQSITSSGSHSYHVAGYKLYSPFIVQQSTHE
jgi:subtilisin family serine protease